mgnify:CR=1 FL=1
MERLFINDHTWDIYAEIIACEDMENTDTYVDEDLLEEESINLSEIKLKHTVA